MAGIAVVDLADYRHGIDALPAVIIRTRRLYGLLGQNGARYLCGRQTVERLDHGFVGKLQRVVDALSLDHLGGYGRGGHGGAAAEGLEFDVLDDPVVVYFKIHLHDVAAGCRADFTDTVGASIVVKAPLLLGEVPPLIPAVVPLAGAVLARHARDGRAQPCELSPGIPLREDDQVGAQGTGEFSFPASSR